MANPMRAPALPADLEVPKASDPMAFTQTPEFKAAVQEALNRALPEIVASIKPMASSPAAIDEATKSLFSQMALTIAQMNDQGTGRIGQRVAPEILEGRSQARERMIDLIIEARTAIKNAKASGDKRLLRIAREEWMPKYRVTAKCYFKEQMIEPYVRDSATQQTVAREIYWDGEPNDALKPINEVAKNIYAEFRASRGNGRITGEAPDTNRQYWISDRGNLAVGRAPTHMRVNTEAFDEFDDERDAAARDEFGDPRDPRSEFVHIVGTVAPPAMRNYQGKAI
jgi:hypothetical protein